MPDGTSGGARSARVGCRAQTGVWAPSVVVGHPKHSQRIHHRASGGRNQPAETLPAYCPDQSLTERLVDGGRKDAIPIVEHKPVGDLCHAERQEGCWTVHAAAGWGSHVPLQDPARTNLEGDEAIEDVEAGRDDGDEVTADQWRRTRMEDQFDAMLYLGCS